MKQNSNGQLKMTDKDKYLERCIECLQFFGVDTNKDYIVLSDGGNSCILNPKTKWKEFLGHSINSIAEFVAKELGKPTKWI